ncbi:MAG: O-sialoglycoprotein endopeptidase [Clostridiales bacterium]|nr:O-sialoglycoprotein endopeptidase [Clostridiales bacterium]
MNGLFLGVDTSNYTTSVSCVSNEGIVFERRTMLSVPLGNRGLRQSDAVFQHVRNLPPLIEAILSSVDRNTIQAVAVSAKPTAAEESYMPVFLAGKLAAVSIASSFDIPIFETTHQAGHVRAALLGQEEQFSEGLFLAMHLSGGTTDLLLVRRENGLLGDITRIGGCDDLHAGQFVDRVGVRLGLPFPSGVSLELLANAAQDRSIKLPANVRGLNCSFSGQESQCQRLIDSGADREAVAYAVYDCMARTFTKLLTNAFAETGVKKALLSGGVSGSLLLRTLLRERLEQELFYAQNGLSSDNAVGTALLARDFYQKQSR